MEIGEREKHHEGILMMRVVEERGVVLSFLCLPRSEESNNLVLTLTKIDR